MILPNGTSLVFIGGAANGNQWSFNTSGIPGLGPTSPFPGGGVAIAILPNGTTIAIPVNPATTGPTNQILCQKGNQLAKIRLPKTVHFRP